MTTEAGGRLAPNGRPNGVAAAVHQMAQDLQGWCFPGGRLYWYRRDLGTAGDWEYFVVRMDDGSVIAPVARPWMAACGRGTRRLGGVEEWMREPAMETVTVDGATTRYTSPFAMVMMAFLVELEDEEIEAMRLQRNAVLDAFLDGRVKTGTYLDARSPTWIGLPDRRALVRMVRGFDEIIEAEGRLDQWNH